MASATVSIIGAGGQLGKELIRSCPDDTQIIDFSGRLEFDITNEDHFSSISGSSVVINCSAFHNVVTAQSSLGMLDAWAVNVDGPRNLAHFCRRTSPKTILVHISTDYVFGSRSISEQDQESRRLLVETDLPDPAGVYGRTKLFGEHAIQDSGVNHIICRTSALYGSSLPRGKDYNFVSLVKSKVLANEPMQIVDDQFTAPSRCLEVASAIWSLLSKPSLGLWHIVNRGAPVSWYEFALEIAKYYVNEERAHELITSRKSTKEELSFRPQYSAMSAEKLSSSVGFYMSHWKSALSNHIGENHGFGAARKSHNSAI